jgi:hypothetical protein
MTTLKFWKNDHAKFLAIWPATIALFILSPILARGSVSRGSILIVFSIDLDVKIDADAPLGEHIGLGRQWLERRPVEFFEEFRGVSCGAAGSAVPR